MAEREWSKVGYRREVYYDRATGQVLGSVQEDLGTGTIRATAATLTLGEYISQNMAKDAVRRAVESNEIRAATVKDGLAMFADNV